MSRYEHDLVDSPSFWSTLAKLCCCGNASQRYTKLETQTYENTGITSGNEQQRAIDLVSRSSDVNQQLLSALDTLIRGPVESQRIAAMALTQLSSSPEKAQRLLPVILDLLLTTRDTDVMKASAAALGNVVGLASARARTELLQSGALNGLIQILDEEQDVAVLSNVCGVVTSLAASPDIRKELMGSDDIPPVIPVLLKLAQHKDVRVARNATGALLNLTHDSGTMDGRLSVVEAGGLKVLTQVAEQWIPKVENSTTDVEVAYYSLTALSNLLVDEPCRARLMIDEALTKRLLTLVIRLLSVPKSTSSATLKQANSFVAIGGTPSILDTKPSARLRLASQAALCLRNLASDDEFQVLILQHDSPPILPTLLSILKSKDDFSQYPRQPYLTHLQSQLILACAALLRNLSISEDNEDILISYRVVELTLDLLNQSEPANKISPIVPSVEDTGSVMSTPSQFSDLELQNHYASIVRNLSSNPDGADALLRHDGLKILNKVMGMYSYPSSFDGTNTSAGEAMETMTATLIQELQAIVAIVAMHDTSRWNLIEESMQGNGCLDRVVNQMDTNPEYLAPFGLGAATVFSNLFAATFTQDQNVVLRNWMTKRWDLIQKAMQKWMLLPGTRDTAVHFSNLIKEYQPDVDMEQVEKIVSRQ